ncbi:MAG: helix-turn-helix domain-containing protein [Candidatus Omnitrophica bacterium]|nr:helix-turn-helix domain-containing protein [Candidatus Omnitrophota bacterium]
MKPKNPKQKQFEYSGIMNPKEAAKYLGLHPITVYRLTKKGQLPGFKLGGQWRFKKDLLDSWIANKINKTSEQEGKITRI